ncbi:MAG: hypothetical protein AB7E34_03770 [Acidaminococcaceae bacterium]
MMQINELSKANINSKKNKQGFMLVDALIAVLIVATGLVSLAFMYTHGIKTRVAGERRQAAVQIAGQEMERLKKYEGGTLSALEDNVHDDTNGHLIQTGLGPTNYEVKSVIVEEYKPSSDEATQKIETVRVIVSWNDPIKNKITLEGYVLVNQ